jgi:hypothetical protein
MSAPNYNTIRASIAAKVLSALLDPGATAGQANIPLSTFNSPNFPGLDMTVGTAIGQFNILGVKGGSAVGAVVDVDLTAIPDPFGTVVNAANIRFLLLLNDDTVAGHILNIGAAATNPWTALFGAGATFKFTVPPGAVLPNTNPVVNFPGMLLVGSPQTGQLPVTGTSKILRLDPLANTVPYRIFLIGDMV